MSTDPRIARHLLGLSQEGLADLLGVAQRTVRRWEVGSHKMPPWADQRLGVLLAQADEQVAAVVELADATGAVVLERVGSPGADAADGHRRSRALAVVARAADQRPELLVHWVPARPA